MLQSLDWANPTVNAAPRSGIRLLDTFLSSKTDYQLVERAMGLAHEGVQVRLLLAAPHGAFAQARAESLASTPAVRLRQGLAHLAEAAHVARHLAVPDLDGLSLDALLALIRGVVGDSVELRFYREFPSGPIYLVGDLALVGRYTAGVSAHRSPWLLVVDDHSCEGDLYDRLHEEFEAIWRASSGAIPGSNDSAPAATRRDALEVVVTVCRNFQRAVSQLATSMDMVDEASVVRLLAALLRPHFDSVLSEEPTPWTAGRGGRLDLLLPEDAIGIEVKLARSGESPKHLFDELLLARERYHAHPNCTVLVCFIYDPAHQVQNRARIAEDLELRDGLTTQVVFAP